MAPKGRDKHPTFRPIIQTFDRLAYTYGKPEGLEEVNRLRLAPFARAMEGLVLDVGCGAGTFINKYFDSSRHSLVSIDFSEQMIAMTRSAMMGHFNRGFSLVHGLAQELPFPNATFDACVCINTVHNMPRWEDVTAAISEMARVLKPGGKMLLEFRNILNPGRRRITKLFDTAALPQKAFSIDQIARELHNAGLEIQQRIPLFGEKPGKSASLDSAMSGIAGARAPRIAVLAVKSKPFETYLNDSDS